MCMVSSAGAVVLIKYPRLSNLARHDRRFVDPYRILIDTDMPLPMRPEIRPADLGDYPARYAELGKYGPVSHVSAGDYRLRRWD